MSIYTARLHNTSNALSPQVCAIPPVTVTASGVKTVFSNKTGNRFVPVIGLCDFMCHMVASPGKEGGRPSKMQLRNHYVNDGLHEVSRRVQCNQTLWLPPGAVASGYISLTLDGSRMQDD